MALLTLSKTNQTYQIKHGALGYYQGMFRNNVLWYPASMCPEFGICEFVSYEEAEACCEWLTPILQRLAPTMSSEVVIEPFDVEMHTRLIDLAKRIELALIAMPIGVA